MNQQVKIEQIEINQQVFRVQKRLLFIDQSLQIVDNYTAPQAWLQVIAKPQYCMLANVSRQSIRLKFDFDNPDSPVQVLLPQATEQIAYGLPVSLDETVFVFQRKRTTRSIEVDFNLSGGAELSPGKTVEGMIHLYNKGKVDDVQFHVGVKGIAAAACEIKPARFNLVHSRKRSVKFTATHPPECPLLAGPYCIEVYAEVDEYPGETAADFQEVSVQPFYNYELTFEPDILEEITEEEPV